MYTQLELPELGKKKHSTCWVVITNQIVSITFVSAKAIEQDDAFFIAKATAETLCEASGADVHLEIITSEPEDGNQ